MMMMMMMMMLICFHPSSRPLCHQCHPKQKKLLLAFFKLPRCPHLGHFPPPQPVVFHHHTHSLCMLCRRPEFGYPSPSPARARTPCHQNNLSTILTPVVTSLRHRHRYFLQPSCVFFTTVTKIIVSYRPIYNRVHLCCHHGLSYLHHVMHSTIIWLLTIVTPKSVQTLLPS